ncbi:hypothetical protein H2200_003416 [Cladophialophora chaetospira]|uniref:Major facilitator superfamily (MFS) profile domain-containing protein n=1 Tax=Cladophialophora chaetospira TaxID=386627 RepID=A0AA39CLE4_9EURO|nr:hypothetical protein H2200_003416 [Cladophialophora chaetospira]
MATNARLRRPAILAALLFSLFLAALDFSIITTAIPSISYQLQSHTANVWIGSAYLLTSATVAPVWGKAAEIWGRKPALLSSIVLFFVGSAVCGWSRTIAQLIAGRAIQGSAAGGIIVLVNISISDLWDARHRSMFLATTGIVWAISAGVGPLLGGVFSEYLTWRWAFWINLPCCFAAFIVLFFTMSPSEPRSVSAGQSSGMDWIGTFSIVGVTIMILLSLDFGGVVSPWDSPKVLSLLFGGFGLLAFFIFWEIKGASSPLIPVHLLNRTSKVSPLLVCFTHGFVNVSSWYFLPVFFQAVRGASPTRSGVLIMPIVVVQAVTGVAAGAITYQFGWVRPLAWVGMALMTLGFGLFAIIGTSTTLALTVFIEIVAALGVGATFQAPLIAYQSAVGSADIAMATALFGFVRSLSTSISVVIGGVVFQNGMSSQSKHLTNALGAQLAQNFSGSTAATNVLTVHALPLYQQAVVKKAYVHSLKDMWAMYAAVGGLGLIAALFLRKQALDQSGSEAPERNPVELVQATSSPQMDRIPADGPHAE